MLFFLFLVGNHGNLAHGLNQLPSAEEIRRTGYTGTIQVSESCSIIVRRLIDKVINLDIFEVVTQPRECVRVSDVLSRLAPKSSLSYVYSLGNGAVGRLGFTLADVNTKRGLNLKAYAGTLSNLTIFSGLSLQNVKLKVEVALDQHRGKFAFRFDGDWIIGSLPVVAVSARLCMSIACYEYPKESYEDEGFWSIYGYHIKNISLRSLIELFVSGAILPVEDKHILAQLQLDAYNDVQLNEVNFRINNWTEEMRAEVHFELNIPGVGSSKVHIYTHTSRGASLGTIVRIEIADYTSLAGAIRAVTGINVAGPIANMQVELMDIIYSTKNVTNHMVSKNQHAAMKKIATIETGIHFFFVLRFVPFQDTTTVKFHMRYNMGIFDFQVFGDYKISIKQFLVKLLGDYNDWPDFSLCAFHLKSIGISNQCTTMRYNSHSKILDFPISVGSGVVPFVRNLVKFTNTRVHILVDDAGKQSLRPIAHATWNLGVYDIPFTFRNIPGVGTCVAEATWPDVDIPIGNYLNKLGKPLLPEEPLRTGFEKSSLSSFSIFKNSSMSMFYLKPIGGIDPSSRFSRYTGMKIMGTADIGSLGTCKVQVLLGSSIIDANSDGFIAMSVATKKAHLPDLVYNITDGKMNLNHVPGSGILRNIDLGVVISSRRYYDGRNHLDISEFKPFRFSNKIFKDLKIDKGINLAGEVKIPTECNGDRFCQFVQNFLGENYKMSIKGHLSPTTLSLTTNRVHSKELMIRKIIKGAQIYPDVFKVSKGDIKLVCSLEFDEFEGIVEEVKFSGSFGVSDDEGVFLEMSSAEWLDNAFGTPFLQFGDLRFKVAIPASLNTTITKIDFRDHRVKARIGFHDKYNNYRPAGHIDAIHVHVSMDMKNPMENYFLGTIKNPTLSVGAINSAFASQYLPGAIEQIAFRRRAMVSFAHHAKILPNVTPIPQGLHFKGVLRILNFDARGDIQVDQSGGFFLSKPPQT